MSTRSCIMIKLRKEDIGKVKKFNAKKLPVKQTDFSCYNESKGREKAQEVKLEHPYIGIYCHSDGYPDGVGKVLKDKFNDYETILNLILGGFCSVVWYDEVRRYGKRSRETWEDIRPTQGEEPEDVYQYIDSSYCYLFDEEKGWQVNDYENDIYKDGILMPAPIYKDY